MESHNRLLEFLVKYLVQGIDAKEKLVRSRICQILNGCLNSVDELSDDVYALYREKMSERLLDKEWTVRVQAVQSLSRFQSDESSGVTEAFIELLQYDPSVDVRKAILSVLEISDKSLLAILGRLRDIDPAIRRLVYRNKISEIDFDALSNTDREWILRNGLNERDDSVKKACLELVFSHWIKKTGNNLVELLMTFDFLENESLAIDLLKGYYSLVPDAFDHFDDIYFENLTGETALIIRTFCEFISTFDKKSSEDGTVVASQALLPEISKMLHYIDAYITKSANQDQSSTKSATQDKSLNVADDQGTFTFIIKQLICMARLFDYSDEVGRRNAVLLLKAMLSNPKVQDSLIPDILLTLQKVLLHEGEFTKVIIEIICDFRDIFGIFSNPDEENLGDHDATTMKEVQKEVHAQVGEAR